MVYHPSIDWSGGEGQCIVQERIVKRTGGNACERGLCVNWLVCGLKLILLHSLNTSVVWLLCGLKMILWPGVCVSHSVPLWFGWCATLRWFYDRENTCKNCSLNTIVVWMVCGLTIHGVMAKRLYFPFSTIASKSWPSLGVGGGFCCTVAVIDVIWY